MYSHFVTNKKKSVNADVAVATEKKVFLSNCDFFRTTQNYIG
jgi:hypothetical protein